MHPPSSALYQRKKPVLAGPVALGCLGRGRKGFTLIEILLAVAVLGILISLALPYFQTQRNKSRTRTAAQQIAAMQVTINGYYADTGSWPSALSDVGLGGQKDPWGRSYQYYNIVANGTGNARKDRALNPINSDYDLYSKGVDGVTAKQLDNASSLDDVVRANSGAFVGLSSDF